LRNQAHPLHITLPDKPKDKDLIVFVDQRPLGHQQRVLPGGGHQLHLDIHPGPQPFLARDGHGDFHRTGTRVHRGSDAVDTAAEHPVAHGVGTNPCGLTLVKPRQLLFGDEDPGHDGIEVHHLEQGLVDGDVVTEVDQPLGHHTGDRRLYRGVGQVALGIVTGQQQLFHLVACIVEHLLADQLLLEELLLPRQLPLGLVQLAVDLGQGGALHIVLELDHLLPGPDRIPFFNQQILHDARRLGIDLDIPLRCEVGGKAEH